MTDFAALARLARIANLAYGESEAGVRRGAEALGLLFAALVQSADCHALVCRAGAQQIVAIAGTHFAQDTSLAEIADNLEGDPIRCGAGLVHEGYFAPLATLWPAIAAQLSDADPAILVGHSMGGVRAHLARYFFPAAREVRVVSFGAPKGADEAFWRAVYRNDAEAPLRIVHAADFAPSWPELGPFTQPGPMLWLRSGGAEPAAARPGIVASVSDHAVETYIAALDALAEKARNSAVAAT